MKFGPVGADTFHANRRTGGRTDVTKLVVASSQFANAPKTFVSGKENKLR